MSGGSTKQDELTPSRVRRIAEEYRRAADCLLALGRKGDPLSRAPFRFTAMHAIELYLNAFLLHAGYDSAELRGLRHDLAMKAKLAATNRLALRRRTLAHLNAMAENREYVTMRYGPDVTATISQVNRLSATLREVEAKVKVALDRPKAPVGLGLKGLAPPAAASSGGVLAIAPARPRPAELAAGRACALKRAKAGDLAG